MHGLRHMKQLSGGSVVTIGVFDGVHIGHRKVINTAVSSAKKSGIRSVVITFDPHPKKVLAASAAVPSLISLKHRTRLIEELGADVLVIVKFTKAFAKTPPEKFVKNIIAGKLRAKEVCVGEDFYFGKAARSGIGILRKLSRRYNFKVTAIKTLKISGLAASSSAIRKLILKGSLGAAEKLLGRPVSIFGTVIKGSGIARGLGCPTANINPHHEVIPPRGVYAVTARSGKKIFRGILNIGFRPTFYSARDKEPTIEVHLFDFNGNLYGRDVEVYFVKKIRDERKFKTRAALVIQIAKDIETAKNFSHQ